MLMCGVYNVMGMATSTEDKSFRVEPGCLQTCMYDQSLSVTETYIPTKFHVEIWFPF